MPSDVKAPILKYTPQNVTPGKGGGAVLPTPKPDDRSFLEDLTLQDITYMVAAVGVLGLILVVAGIIGIRRSRAGRRAAAGSGGPARGSAARTPDGDLLASPDEGGTGTVYGGRPAARPPAAPRPAGQSTAAVGAPAARRPTRATSTASRGMARRRMTSLAASSRVAMRSHRRRARSGPPQGGVYGGGGQGGYDRRGVYGGGHPGDHDGYERGYAPHR